MYIPKIIHQLWIGPKPMPKKFMDTWKDKHPGFEYICWTEEEFRKRNMNFQCVEAIHCMPEINGKADIMRWEILCKYGGIFIDADSICIQPLDEMILSQKSFAAHENEMVRKGLLAPVLMGYYPQHPICRFAVEWILQNKTIIENPTLRAWQTVGPGLLTRAFAEVKNNDLVIFPSFFFLPIHHTGLRYQGHKRVYGYQEWGSTKKNYDIMNQLSLPEILTRHEREVSILISSYNTKQIYIRECLESILNQTGDFSIEIIWVNDGSNDVHTDFLRKELQHALNQSRFTKIKYKANKKNSGLVYSLNKGLELCSNEVVFRMDADDIMHPERITKQLQFLNAHPDSVICGTNVIYMKRHPDPLKIEYISTGQTNHPEKLTWESYKSSASPSLWFMNHPTLCFKKSVIKEIGGYMDDIPFAEDYHLEMRILKKYGVIYNLPDLLLYYRIHEDQITFKGKHSTQEMNIARSKFIHDMISP
jgi:GT2 family glycosyltransferase